MSFNSKNLTYGKLISHAIFTISITNCSLEKKEPAFLRRLKGEYGDGGTTPQARRPAKSRLALEDDEPTYVDEESNEVITKEEYAAMLDNSNKGEGRNKTEEAEIEGNTTQKHSPQNKVNGKETKQKVVEIGTAKKRKQRRAIGEVSQETETPPVKKSQKSKQKKKIKLSFDEGEE